MQRLTVCHRTIYRYHQPVTFNEHRLMFRPRDSHDLRLVDTRLVISPPARIRWYHDVFNNSIAVASFDQTASRLVIESDIVVDVYAINDPEFPLAPWAQTIPFTYPESELPDLAPVVRRHYHDDGRVEGWAKSFLNGEGTAPTEQVLRAMTDAIRYKFTYGWRDAPGTQSPLETLDRGAGSCRDYALFMMEALRSLGVAARFVSGYLYDPAIDGAGEQLTGGGSTHAWVEAYLPGAGWVSYDPTNGLVGGANLIRVAVARDPAQAVPVEGSFTGLPGDFIDMTVEVTVTAQGAQALRPSAAG